MREESDDPDRAWEADRTAVLARDDHTCRRCGVATAREGSRTADPTASSASGDRRSNPAADTPASSAGSTEEPGRVTAVGDVPLQGSVHESALVTVCEDCYGRLTGESAATPLTDRDTLFETMQAATTLQSEAISNVAAFASLATTIPSRLQAAEDPQPDYVRERQDALVHLVAVDGTLDALEAAADDPAVESLATDRPEPEAGGLGDALAAFCGTARGLQEQLWEVVELAETVAIGLGHCRGCFDGLELTRSATAGHEQPLLPQTCPTCRLERRAIDEWRREDGTVRFDGCYAAINAALQASSRTTTTLTVRTQTVARRLLPGDRAG